MRLIFHLDMDAFFVSVEELRDPSLKGKPVVVGGKAHERGVVSAASYAARKYGVRSAMPLREAYRRCPQAIFLDGHPDDYRDYSRKVHAILRDFSPLVEQVSIDEAFLDLTGARRLLGPPLAAAHKLHEKVRSETGLPCSIGAGSSRLVAKIGSGLAKPNGVLWVEPGLEPEFLAPLDIKKIPGVGKVMQKSLRDCGIHRIGQLRQVEPSFLEQRFGKTGLALVGKAQGHDAGGWFQGEIGDRSLPKSISHETTFSEDTADRELLDATIAKLVQLVARRLREHALWTRTIQLKLRYEDFSTITRAHTLDEPTQLDNVILETVRELFRRNWQAPRPIRLIGVQAGSLGDPARQASLLDGGDRKKWERALQAADKLRDRFGETAVGLAAAMRHGRRERVHENPAGLPGRGKDDD
ncbi:MAG: DNA polymerase IV [Bryobacterales bacterium]